MRVCADKKIILLWCTGRLLPHLSFFSAFFLSFFSFFFSFFLDAISDNSHLAFSCMQIMLGNVQYFRNLYTVFGH